MNRLESARIVQFVGGPSDGLVVRDPQFKTNSMLRISPIGQRATTYVLIRQQRRMEGDQMINCLRYEFLGYECLESPASRDVAQPTKSHGRNRLRRWCSTFGRRFASWMLEPINYPLKMRGDAIDRVSRS